eukprot:SAG11_NODE_20891_length_436_cov_0.919881_1_plen_55_part_00
MLIATPGRLVDFIERRRVSLANIIFVVLDEADRCARSAASAACLPCVDRKLCRG